MSLPESTVATNIPTKKHKLFHFIDWRPVATTAINPHIAQVVEPLEIEEVQEIKNKIPNLDDIDCVLRTDGLFILQLKFAEPEVVQGVRSVAASISNAIKSDCGHYHLFHDNEYWTDILDDPYPLAIYTPKSDITQEDFHENFLSDEYIAKINCIHPTKGGSGDYSAVLRLKLNFSNLRDKLLRKAKYDFSGSNYAVISIGKRLRYLSNIIIFGAIILGIVFVPGSHIIPALGNLIDTAIDWIANFDARERASAALFCSGLSLIPGWVLIRENRKIIEQRIHFLENAIGYFSFGPVLFAVVENVWFHAENSGTKPGRQVNLDNKIQKSHAEPHKLSEPLCVLLEKEKWRWQKIYNYTVLLAVYSGFFIAVLTLIATIN